MNILSLPAELLALIFVEHVASSSGKSAAELRAVCKRWRDVAQATPSIWDGMLIGYGTQWTQRALEWSGSRPIDLDSRVESATDWHESMLLVLRHLQRIRDVYIEFPTGYFRGRTSQVVNIFKDRPAPLLEAFHLNGFQGQGKQPELGDLFGPAPPPRLKDVKLYRCIIALHCSIFRAPELTLLTIDDCELWSSVEEVLGTLKALPQLQHFIWLDPTPNVTKFTDSTLMSSRLVGVGPVQMSSLRSLNIRHNVEVVVHLLACVELPPKCNITIRANLEHNPSSAALVDAMDRVLSPSLSARFPTGSGTGFAGFDIVGFYEHYGSGVTAQWFVEDAGVRGAEEEFGLTLYGGSFEDDELLMMIWWMIDRWPATRVAVRHILASHHAAFGISVSELTRYIPS